MSKPVHILHAIRNFVTGAGTENDQAMHREYDSRGRLKDQQLSDMYAEQWLTAKVIDIPAKDMIRPWRTFSDPERSHAYTEAEKRLKLKKRLLSAYKWARLYGGAVLVPSYDNSVSIEQYKQPFNLETIANNTLRGFRVFVQGQFAKKGNAEVVNILDDRFGWPELFEISQDSKSTHKFLIHSSWLIPLTGAEMPPFRSNCRSRDNWRWGDSVIERIYDDIERALVGLQETSSMMHRINIDVYKVKDLAEQLANCNNNINEMYQTLAARLSLVALTTSNHNKMVVDAEQEDFARHDLNVAGWDKVTMTFVQLVAAGADIPLTRFLGQSPGGLDASGDSDLSNYYDGLAGTRDDDITPRIDDIDQIIAHDMGVEVPEWEWNPLWQLSEKDQSEVNKRNAETFNIYKTADIPFIDVLEAERLQRDSVYNFTDEQIEEIKETSSPIDLGDPE